METEVAWDEESTPKYPARAEKGFVMVLEEVP